MGTQIQSDTAAQTKKTLLLLWGAMLFALAMYFVLMRMVPASSQPGAEGLFFTILLALAAGLAAVTLYLRVALIGRLLSKATPLSEAELGKLRSYYIVCFALSEAVGLYGLVLHLLGISLPGVLPFFAAAAMLLLVCFPAVPARS